MNLNIIKEIMQKKRCLKCNKKIKSVMIFPCKCENYYCNKHKIPQDHNCSFNFIKEHQEKLRKKNKKIIADKLEGMISN